MEQFTYMSLKKLKKLFKRENREKNQSLFRKFYHKYAKKHWKLVVFALILNCIVALTTSAVAYLIGPAVGDVFGKKSIKLLFSMCVAIVSCYVVKAFAVYFYTLSMNFLSLKIVNALRFDIFKTLVSMKMTDINNLSKGRFMTLLQNDINKIQSCIGELIIEIVKDVVQIVTLTIVVFKANWKMALFVCFCYPIIFVPLRKLNKTIKEKAESQQESWQLITSKTMDVQNGISTIKAYNSIKAENVYFLKLIKDLVKKTIVATKIWSLYSPINEIFGGILISILMIMGGYQVIYNAMTLADFVSFLAALMMMIRPIKRFIDNLSRVPAYIVSMERVDDFLTNTEKEQIFVGERPDLTSPLIEFKNVNFNYNIEREDGENENIVLNNINFTIKPKSKIAFVGLSGSGKTTIMNLLLRLYDIESGEILINGTNIQDIAISHLRKNVAYVCQDNFLFDSTIRENIIYNTPKSSFTQEEFEEAIANAKAEFVHQLPNGVDEEVGLDGSRLSMGQKQRIAIARALLRKAPIMIFDEVTSALDANTEADIRDMIFKEMKDKTVFLIAHRLTTITDCDCIYVMSKGEIVEYGTHKELLEKKGMYNTLWQNFQHKTID